MKRFKRFRVIFQVLFLVLFLGLSICMAEPQPKSEDLVQLYKQIDLLKKKVEELEKRIRQREVKEEKLRKDIEEVKEAKKTIEEIKERIGNISIHGGVVSYYQGRLSRKLCLNMIVICLKSCCKFCIQYMGDRSYFVCWFSPFAKMKLFDQYTKL